MDASLSTTLCGATSHLTLTTTITALSSEQSLTIFYPSPAISQSPQFTTVTRFSGQGLTTVVLPVAILTDVVGDIVNTFGSSINTGTLIQVSSSQPSGILVLGGEKEGKQSGYACSSTWRCWPLGEKIGTVFAIILAAIAILGLLIWGLWCLPNERVVIGKSKSDDGDLEAGRRLKERAGLTAVSEAKREKRKKNIGSRRVKHGRKRTEPSFSGSSGSGTDSEVIFERRRGDPPMMASNSTLAGDATQGVAPTAGQRNRYKEPPTSLRVKDFATGSAVSLVDLNGRTSASNQAPRRVPVVSLVSPTRQSRASTLPPRILSGRAHDGYQQKYSPLNLSSSSVEYNEYKKEKRDRTAESSDERKVTEPPRAGARGRRLEQQLSRRRSVLRRADEDVLLHKFPGGNNWEVKERTRSRPRARSWSPPRTRQPNPEHKEKRSIWKPEFWLAALPFVLEAMYHLAEPRGGWEKCHKDKDAAKKKKRDQAKSSRRHRENLPRGRAMSIDGSELGRSQRRTMPNEGVRTGPGPNLTARSQRRGSVQNGPSTRPVRRRGGMGRFVNFEEEVVPRYEVSADSVNHVRGLGLIFG